MGSCSKDDAIKPIIKPFYFIVGLSSQTPWPPPQDEISIIVDFYQIKHVKDSPAPAAIKGQRKKLCRKVFEIWLS